MHSTTVGADLVELVLFDLGGVVFTFDWQVAIDHWARCARCEPGMLAERFGYDEDHQRFERGELTPGEYFALLRARLGVDLSEEDLVAGWNSIFGEVIEGMADLIAAVHSSPYRVAALSNTNATHASTWPSNYGDVLANLGRIYTSHELGHRKPEAACYRSVCDHLGLEPSAVLFFDDSAANVDAARRFGMQAVLVERIDDVRAALATLGVY